MKVSRLPTSDVPEALTFSQPGRGFAAVAIAKSVALAKIATPEQRLFQNLPSQSEGQAQGSAVSRDIEHTNDVSSGRENADSKLPASTEIDSAAEDVIDDLKAHLKQQRHVLALVGLRMTLCY